MVKESSSEKNKIESICSLLEYQFSKLSSTMVKESSSESNEIESILQFMYLGEGKFLYERMDEFLKVSKDLEVKEICKGVEEEDVTEKTVMKDEKKENDKDHISTKCLKNVPDIKKRF